MTKTLGDPFLTLYLIIIFLPPILNNDIGGVFN
jgi:hypothetical protein